MLGTWLQPSLSPPGASRLPILSRAAPMPRQNPASLPPQRLPRGVLFRTRPAWMLPDSASVIARVVPCTPHVLLPTSLRGKGSHEHVFQMRTLKPRVLPLRTQGQAGAGLGLKTESKTPENACFQCASSGVCPAAGRVLPCTTASRRGLGNGQNARPGGAVPDEAGGHSLIVATARVCARLRSKHHITLSHASLIFTRNGRYYGYLHFTWKKDRGPRTYAMRPRPRSWRVLEPQRFHAEGARTARMQTCFPSLCLSPCLSIAHSANRS